MIVLSFPLKLIAAASERLSTQRLFCHLLHSLCTERSPFPEQLLKENYKYGKKIGQQKHEMSLKRRNSENMGLKYTRTSTVLDKP